MTIKNRKEISSEITELEQEKELLVEEKSALRKKSGDKKREISVLRRQLKKAEKAEKAEKPRNLRKARQKLRIQEGKEKEKEEKKEKRSIVSLSVLLFVPVISATLLLSILYANAVFPFETLDFLATHYPLVIPFIIFSISLICLIASGIYFAIYFAIYQALQNFVRARRSASARERESLERSQTVMVVAILCVAFVLFSCFTIIATVEAVNRLFWWVPRESRVQHYPLIIAFWCAIWVAFCVKSYFMISKPK